MKHIPILFSTPMVQAILDGRKTMTRRVIKPQPDEDGLAKFLPTRQWHDTDARVYKCPYGKPGDILWVRETFANLNADFPTNPKCYVYKADDLQGNSYGPVTWKPSIHIPKEACRLFLKVTDVRVERLQEISEDDAKAEGIEKMSGYYRDYLNRGGNLPPYASFQSLWQSINGPESWDANPWVWVIQFERIQKPENFIV